MLLVDAANVVGSRPDGWWRDRRAAARNLYDRLTAATREGRIQQSVVLVLEGDARPGVAEGTVDNVRVVHASGLGDDTLVAEAAAAHEPVTLVSADRELRERVQQVGGQVVGPRWLLDHLTP